MGYMEICRKIQKALFVITFFSLMLGCATDSKRPFMIVQLCVSDDKGVLEFKSLLKSIAHSESMEFLDGSENTQIELKEMYIGKNKNFQSNGIIHIGVEGKDGLGLTAANIGLEKYQIAVGFSEGNSHEKSILFSRKVVRYLEMNWNVEIVPNDRGVFPMKSCK